MEGSNASISIQAFQQIQVGGTFTGGALTVPGNRDRRLEVKAGGAGGIAATQAQCAATGASTPSRLPPALIRPASNWRR
jgi:hypothetical protein